MEQLLLDIFGLHKAEILSLGWQSILVLIVAEFISRLSMAWYDVKNEYTPRRDKLSRAIGLSTNGIAAFLFVLSNGIPWKNMPYTTMLYAGLTMIMHVVLDKYVIRKYLPKYATGAPVQPVAVPEPPK